MPQKFRVAITSKRNYDRLMSAYQKKGWVWRDGTKPKSEPFVRSCFIDFHNAFGRCLNFDSCPGEMDCSGYTTITFAEAMRRLRGNKTTKTTTKKSLRQDIGKRVVGIDAEGIKIKGILLAVDCDKKGREPHLIRRLDDRGWSGDLLHFCPTPFDRRAIEQGVSKSEEHLWWIQSYVLDTKKTKKKATKPKLHPWLGKRVILKGTYEGILAAVNVESAAFRHYIIRDDGEGWCLSSSSPFEAEKIKKQGVVKTKKQAESMWGFNNLSEIELCEEPKEKLVSLSSLSDGDIVKQGTTYHRVLNILPAGFSDNSKAIYFLSSGTSNYHSSLTGKMALLFTLQELEDGGFKRVVEE